MLFSLFNDGRGPDIFICFAQLMIGGTIFEFVVIVSEFTDRIKVMGRQKVKQINYFGLILNFIHEYSRITHWLYMSYLLYHAIFACKGANASATAQML